MGGDGCANSLGLGDAFLACTHITPSSCTPFLNTYNIYLSMIPHKAKKQTNKKRGGTLSRNLPGAGLKIAHVGGE